MYRGKLSRAIVAAVMSVAAVAGGLAVTGEPARAALLPEEIDGWQGEVGELVNALDERSTGDPLFAAVGLDAASRTVFVYRKGGAATDHYATVPVPPGTRVAVRPAVLSEAESRQVMDRVKADSAALAEEGIVVHSVTAALDGPLVIQVESPSLDTQDALRTRYGMFGADTVRVEQGEPVQPQSRTTQRPPFFAGSRINSAGGSAGYAQCTTGFGGLSTTNGHRYIVTAYHCHRPGNARFWITNSEAYVGEATVLDPAHDLAYIRTSTTLPWTWDGTMQNQTTRYVTGVVRPAVGAQVCESGSFTGARCYATVRNWAASRTCTEWHGCFWSDLWFADSNNGRPMTQGGDSGGPVFMRRGGNVTAVGIHSGASHAGSRVWFANVYRELYQNHHLNLLV